MVHSGQGSGWDEDGNSRSESSTEIRCVSPDIIHEFSHASISCAVRGTNTSKTANKCSGVTSVEL